MDNNTIVTASPALCVGLFLSESQTRSIIKLFQVLGVLFLFKQQQNIICSLVMNANIP